MEWIFNGIGTELLVFLIGIMFGVVGHKIYISNKQSQRSGNNSIQIQCNGATDGKISANKISGNQYSPIGDYIGRDKIILNKPDEFDICNFTHYSNTQIENVIEKGNNEILRKWCLELIINQKDDHLILQCINKMDNDSEKYKLLKALSERNFEDSEYFVLIGKSLSNGIYQTKAIKLYILIGKIDYIESVFRLIENNKYIYDSLIAIYECNRDVFIKLYDSGKCFDNKQYKRKMLNFLINKNIIVNP